MTAWLLPVACATPGGPLLPGAGMRPTFNVGIAADPAPVAVQASPVPVQAPPTADDPVDPAPMASPNPAGNGGGSAPGLPQAPAGAYLALPNGRTVAVPEGETVGLPADVRGEVTVFAPGHVPSTIELSGPTPPTSTVPQKERSPGRPETMVTVSGTIASGESDLVVQYVSPGRRLFAGTRSVSGAFAFQVRVSAAEAGLLVAREDGPEPRMALSRLHLSPEAGTVTAGPLTLVEIAGGAPSAPTPPAGMSVIGTRLQALVGDGVAATPVTLLSMTGANMPLFDIPGITLMRTYTASDASGDRAAETGGAVEDIGGFLTPPDLNGISRPVPGRRLSWPGVPGATLYTIWIGDRYRPDPPLWEAATTQPGVRVPAQLDLPGRPLTVQVTAWACPAVSIYSVAAARHLRVPTETPGARGRWSRMIRTFEP